MRTKIVYEDASILVCCKPAGLATQTSRVGQQDVVSELKNYLAKQRRSAEPDHNQSVKAASPYLGIIHRLDQPVEGLLVFAKDSRSAGGLTASLTQGILNKQYYAVVCGQPKEKSAELVDYLTKDEVTGSTKVAEEAAGGKKAILQYRVVGQISAPVPISMLDIHIHTGRFHQIRAQMAHAGLPLLGDVRYGSEQSKQLSQELKVRNVALCAYQITLKHPVTGEVMEFREEPKGEIFARFV